MWPPEPPEPEDETDVSPSQPLGMSEPVSVTIPIPTIAQVTGEAARHLVGRIMSNDVMREVREKILTAVDGAIDETLNAHVKPLIAEMLESPLQRTDTFGKPVGDPTTLREFIRDRVTQWASDMVDKEGNFGKPDHYSRDRYQPRLNRILAEVVNSELRSSVDNETRRLVKEIKERGEKQIAAQIAERLTGLIIKA